MVPARLSPAVASVGRVLLPRSCPGCRRPARSICAACRVRLAASPADPLVMHAVARRVGLDHLTALWVYEPTSRGVVMAVKNRARADLTGPLAAALALRVGAPPDVVTWVPASGRGRRRRGYDQGELLATRVAHQLGVPRRRLLVRRDPGGGRRRSRRQRLEGPALAARRALWADGGRRPRVHRVLLIDDVVTTGGSLAAATRVLRAAGFAAVDAAVLAVVDDQRPSSARGGGTDQVAGP